MDSLDIFDLENLAISADEDGIVTLSLNRPAKRNALALDVMLEVTSVLQEIGRSDALGVILAANGPVFSAGHNFGDMAGASLDDALRLFEVCTDMMDTVQGIPLPSCSVCSCCSRAASTCSSARPAPSGRCSRP